MKIKNEPFRFKQFEVYHHLCAHKVGFDGVLLGAYADTKDASTILDVGTGSGLIALIAAQKNSSAQITGIELDHESAKQAAYNFDQSPWKNRIHLIEGDFLSTNFNQKFDCILSNPPFFLNSTNAPNQRRNNARNIDKTNFSSLLIRMEKLLATNGKINLILTFIHLSETIDILEPAGLQLTKQLNVITNEKGEPSRVILEFGRNPTELTIKNLIVYESYPKHTEEYIKLTQDFYLNL